MGVVAVWLQRAARHQSKSPVCSAACRTILASSKHIGFPLHNSSLRTQSLCTGWKIARLSILQLRSFSHARALYLYIVHAKRECTNTHKHAFMYTYTHMYLCLPLSLSTPLGENNEPSKPRGSACKRRECVGSLWGCWQTDEFVPSLTLKLIFHGNAATLNEAIGCACIGCILERIRICIVYP